MPTPSTTPGPDLNGLDPIDMNDTTTTTLTVRQAADRYEAMLAEVLPFKVQAVLTPGSTWDQPFSRDAHDLAFDVWNGDPVVVRTAIVKATNLLFPITGNRRYCDGCYIERMDDVLIVDCQEHDHDG